MPNERLLVYGVLSDRWPGQLLSQGILSFLFLTPQHEPAATRCSCDEGAYNRGCRSADGRLCCNLGGTLSAT